MTTPGDPGSDDALLFDARAVAAAQTLVILVPGALTRLEMFDAVKSWASPQTALVYYRFPGLDGRPLAPKLNIEAAAARIAAFAARQEGKRIRLLGYSTGGPIAIRAAEALTGDIRVAAMCSAVERAGGFMSFQRITRDLLGDAVRVRSVRRRTVWRVYFQKLLFGSAVLTDTSVAEHAQALLEAHLPRMVYPDADILAAHSDDLRKWRLPDARRLTAERLAFFTGTADPVFSMVQTQAFAARFGAPVHEYEGHGHLLFMTHPPVFDDIAAFLGVGGQ